jgi:hypothetical protein
VRAGGNPEADEDRSGESRNVKGRSSAHVLLPFLYAFRSGRPNATLVFEVALPDVGQCADVPPHRADSPSEHARGRTVRPCTKIEKTTTEYVSIDTTLRSSPGGS